MAMDLGLARAKIYKRSRVAGSVSGGASLALLFLALFAQYRLA
jgi:hypothetical protein